MDFNAQIYEANARLLNNLGLIAIVIGIIIIGVIIGLICAIFDTKRNTEQTARELKEIKHQNEYICQALNYMINNDGNFRADKPQYIPKPKKEPNALEKLFGMKR